MNMNNIRFLFLLILTVLLTACGWRQPPECSNRKVARTVEELLDDNFLRFYRETILGSSPRAKDVHISLQNPRLVRMEETNPPIRLCAIDVVTEFNGDLAKMMRQLHQSPRQSNTVSYRVMRTETGDVWVELVGL